ncbi:MAG: Maf family protein [Rhodospirillales bacterium]|nr:Maf family protein [Rhodospirillales bacterium]
MSRLILASGSAVRAKLLTGAGLTFDIKSADVDEGALKKSQTGSDVASLAEVLAQAKAHAVSADTPDALVIGADQVLDCEGRLYDKPVGEEGVRSHLMSLRGRVHRLISAVCVAEAGTISWSDTAVATLTMRDFDDNYLEYYIHQAGPEVQSSVGAYRLEDIGVQLFERIEGDYFTILGLPLLPLLSFLRQRGILL